VRRVLPIILLLASALRAADAPPAISATFRALAFYAPITDAAYAISENERIPLLITSDFLTGEQRYHGPADLRFTHLSADLTEKPLAGVRLEDNARVILLFVPDGSGGQAIKVLRDTLGDFPFGTLRFINLTGNRVKVVTGNRTQLIDIGGDQVVRPAAKHQEYAMTEILTERADGFARGYLVRTFQEDNVRAIYFLLPADPREHAILLKGIEERQVDEKAAPAPKPTPITLKPRDNGGGARNGPAVSGQPRDARR